MTNKTNIPTITMTEVRKIVQTAINECSVSINDPDIISGGYSTCAFCGKAEYWNTKNAHYNDCLVYDLQRIINSKIVEDK